MATAFWPSGLLIAGLGGLLCAATAASGEPAETVKRGAAGRWIGVHMLAPSPELLSARKSKWRTTNDRSNRQTSSSVASLPTSPVIMRRTLSTKVARSLCEKSGCLMRRIKSSPDALYRAHVTTGR